MDVDYHAKEASQFAVYEGAGTKTKEELMYLGLGLAEEAGEVAGKISKLYRDRYLDEQTFIKELGDVYWFLGQLCLASNIYPSEVLMLNYNKLAKRSKENKLHGSGDDR